jgi:calcium-dependent protein kinase
MTFITTHLVNGQEQNEMKKMFESMDQNFDGKLNKQELIDGFEKLGRIDPEGEAEHIMAHVDFDNNGCIEFSEWCSASMDKRNLLSKDRLRAAFTIFDKNGNGTIDFLEVKELLGRGGVDSQDAEFKEMIKEMDINGDGEISFDEFEAMMKLLIIRNQKE